MTNKPQPVAAPQDDNSHIQQHDEPVVTKVETEVEDGEDEQGEDDEESPREVGTVVDVEALPFEVRKDGSQAHFTQEKADKHVTREVGS